MSQLSTERVVTLAWDLAETSTDALPGSRIPEVMGGIDPVAMRPAPPGRRPEEVREVPHVQETGLEIEAALASIGWGALERLKCALESHELVRDVGNGVFQFVACADREGAAERPASSGHEPGGERSACKQKETEQLPDHAPRSSRRGLTTSRINCRARQPNPSRRTPKNAFRR
jgi:hypothetical protein